MIEPFYATISINPKSKIDMTDDELRQIVASNAKAIEALSSSLAAERKERQNAYAEWEKDRNQLYQYLGRVAAAQSSFYEVQADYYHQLTLLSERQTRIEEKLTRILERISSSDTDLGEA